MTEKTIAPGDAANISFTPSTTGAAATNVRDKLREYKSPLDSGAAGDGTTDDTQKFVFFEKSVSGKIVDLHGRTHAVDAVPVKNSYVNGFFKVANYTYAAALFDSTHAFSHKAHRFGGQLAKLKNSLCNPLEQFTGIVFIGDSITWGAGLRAEMGQTDPRDGSLSDPRQAFAAASFVNLVKRHIGKAYALDTAPALSNWPASEVGEAVVEYTRSIILYPFEGDFMLASHGAGLSDAEVREKNSLTGFQRQLGHARDAGTSAHVLSFLFTCTAFTLSFGADASGSDYELIVDGVSQGRFTTRAGKDGLSEGNDRRREHRFGYVRDKKIEIRSVTDGADHPEKSIFRVEAIIIDKTIRIANQGINGATTASYKMYNMAGNTYRDGEAVGKQDNYVFVQFGANDRLITPARPKGVNTFKANLGKLLDLLTPTTNAILMCSNPAAREDPEKVSFSMQDVRNAVYRTAKENSIDMIDNYAIFADIDHYTYTAEGTHPNVFGYARIARNIINAIDCSD
jgi:lysophospholipase L1-like esterase